MRLSLFVALLCCSLAVTAQSVDATMSNAAKGRVCMAMVHSVNGVPVFIWAEPLLKHEVIGTFFYPDVSGNIKRSIDSVQFYYPKCDGVIYRDNNYTIGDAIRFK
jgi:hypothetical protein